MKNITLSADADLIEKARERATTATAHTTLNAQFRIWLENYAQREQKSVRTFETIHELQASIFSSGRKFSREEMNER